MNNVTIYPMTWATPARIKRQQKAIKTRRNRKLSELLFTFTILLLLTVILFVSGNSAYSRSRCRGFGLDSNCNLYRVEVAK